MIKNILLTFSTRMVTSVLSLVNVLIGTNYLGASGYGTVSLIIVGITLFLLISNVVCGAPIVYYHNRIGRGKVTVIGFIWVGITAILFAGIISFIEYLGNAGIMDFDLIPPDYTWDVLGLGVAYSILNIFLSLLLGEERIKAYNTSLIIQHIGMTGTLLICFLVIDLRKVESYVIGIAASYVSALIYAASKRSTQDHGGYLPNWSDVVQMIRFGAFAQMANLFQLTNYRLSYYLIDHFIGRGALGLFSAATQITEGLWIFSKSIATVQFARIANLSDRSHASQLTLRLLKFASAITVILLIILLIIPSNWYMALLGAEFEHVRSVLLRLSPGTVALACSLILSHYFSGTAQIVQNTISSGLGVIGITSAGLVLIPEYGIFGAAWAVSLSYLISTGYLWIRFYLQSTHSLRAYLWSMSDVREFRSLILGLLGRN